MASADGDIEVFQEKYAHFVQERGVLFEKVFVQLDDADRKRVRNHSRFVLVFLSFFTSIFFAVLYFDYPDYSHNNGLDGAIMAIILIAGFLFNHYGVKGMIVKNVKTVIKGVVTGKKRGSGNKSYKCEIKISNLYERTIRVPDYKKLKLGDIVQLEIIGNPKFTIISPKVVLLGELP